MGQSPQEKMDTLAVFNRHGERMTMKTTRWYLNFFLCLALVIAVSACAGDRTNRSTGQAVDDNVIAEKVKSNLIADPAVKGMQIDVEVFKGVVQLSGFVDHTSNAQKAVTIARNVDGVREVRNSLIVK